MRQAVLSMFLVLLVIGCGGEREEGATAATPAAATSMTPEQLAEIGTQIEKDPGRANEILSQHGLTQESYEQAIRRVTEDPEASRRYTAAFNKPAA